MNWLGLFGLTLCGLSVLAMLALTLSVVWDGERDAVSDGFDEWDRPEPVRIPARAGPRAVRGDGLRRASRALAALLLLVIASAVFSQLALLLTSDNVPDDPAAHMTVREAQKWSRGK